MGKEKKERPFKDNLRAYMEAGLPILYIDALEYVPVEKILEEAAHGVEPKRTVLRWTPLGLYDEADHSKTQMDLEKTLDILLKDKKNLRRRLLIIEDVHFFLDKPEIIARLREFARLIDAEESKCIKDFTVALVAPLGAIPKELEAYLTIMTPDFLTPDEIKGIIRKFVEENEVPELVPSFLETLAMEMKGLSEEAIVNILSLANQNDGKIDAADLELVRDQKKQTVKKSGILEMVEIKESIDDIGGLENLKEWLTRKAEVFNNSKKAKEYGVDMPKGVLLAGMPGCGKSLTAKAAAATFKVPLLQLDMGRLMGKYVGDSESNMRRATHLADASAPCVLWVDELEKAFAGVGGGGSEVTTRLFGHFLTWMQEKKSMAFVFATANDISVLPPELLRKGRFDEVFYVDLPNEAERKKIFEIHIKKRRKDDLESIQEKIDELVAKTEGYCGADIEGVVKEAVEMAFYEGKGKRSLTVEDILKVIDNTHSLSEIMANKIKDLKQSYADKKLKPASNGNIMSDQSNLKESNEEMSSLEHQGLTIENVLKIIANTNTIMAGKIAELKKA